jgi:hypothetical protein
MWNFLIGLAEIVVGGVMLYYARPSSSPASFIRPFVRASWAGERTNRILCAVVGVFGIVLGLFRVIFGHGMLQR